MNAFSEICGAFLVSVGLLALIGAIWGRLLLPNLCPATMVVAPQGAAEGLEQTVRALLWLRRAGLWRGNIRVEPKDLTAEGRVLTLRLAERYGLELNT